MSTWKDKQLGGFIDNEVVLFLKANLGIYYMPGTVLGQYELASWYSPVLLVSALRESSSGMSKPTGK